MKDELVQTIENLYHPQALVLRNDTGSRELEGLPLYTEVAIGTLPESIQMQETAPVL